MDDPVAALVRERDRDRYVATLWAPAAARAGLFALHALDLELMAVVRTTTEPMLGQIRLAWWRERLEGLDAGAVPAQPVLEALAAHVLPAGVTGASLTGLEDAMLALLAAPRDIAQHVQQRGRTLFGAAAAVLGQGADVAWQLGDLWASGEVARLGETPPLAVHLARVPRPLRSLRALAKLAARDLAAAAPEPRGTPRRQLAIAATMLTGH